MCALQKWSLYWILCIRLVFYVFYNLCFTRFKQKITFCTAFIFIFCCRLFPFCLWYNQKICTHNICFPYKNIIHFSAPIWVEFRFISHKLQQSPNFTIGSAMMNQSGHMTYQFPTLIYNLSIISTYSIQKCSTINSKIFQPSLKQHA